MKTLFLAISLMVILLTVTITSVNEAYADVIPPKKQTKIGISNDKVVCDSGKFKVIKEGKNSVACLKPSSVTKLVTKGWAQPVDESKLNELISKLEVSSGKINKLLVTPIKTDFGKEIGKVSVGSYDYVFEVCAGSQPLVSPEVIIHSDSETKNYELAETVDANTCVPSATIIKAASPDSISATLVSKGDVSQIITSAMAKVETLKQELLEAKQSIGKGKSEENKQQGNKIADTRKKLNDARAELHRLYFILYTPVKSANVVEKMSFSGTPIQGQTATIISISESVATPDTYDVVFEACAGEKQVRIPIIMISSDNQDVNVKLGDKIAPNTCQLTSAKIGATDTESIAIKVAGNADSSTKASDLESKIADLQKQLIISKDRLKDLVHDSDRPEDFNEQVTSQVEKISKLRNDIISAKAQLSKILYQTYRQ